MITTTTKTMNWNTIMDKLQQLWIIQNMITTMMTKTMNWNTNMDKLQQLWIRIWLQQWWQKLWIGIRLWINYNNYESEYDYNNDDKNYELEYEYG